MGNCVEKLNRLTTFIRTQEYIWSDHSGKSWLIEKWTAPQKDGQRGCHPKNPDYIDFAILSIQICSPLSNLKNILKKFHKFVLESSN